MQPTIESLLVGLLYHLMFLSILVAQIIYWYILFFTSFSWIIVLYSLWAFVIDSNTIEKGGRRSELYRNLSMWQIVVNYFSCKLVFEPDTVLETNKNYICACFPHGVMPIGPTINFITSSKKYFPQHSPYILVQKILLFIPFCREYMLWAGLCCASKNTIRWLLNQPDKGKILVIMVGGAEESLYSRPGNYHIILKNRKGFIKLALENGTSLVPVFTFGEIEVFDQIGGVDSPLFKFQKILIKYLGFVLIWPVGCGLFGLIPRKVPLTTVVGKPISVEKVINPTNEQIEVLHEKFVDAVKNLFENNKHKYLKNHEEIFLIMH